MMENVLLDVELEDVGGRNHDREQTPVAVNDEKRVTS